MNNITPALHENIEGYLSARNNGKVLYGIWDLDQCLGGVHPHELICLGARQKTGKTTFACFLTLKWIREGKKVVYFSNEMTKEAIYLKIAGQQCHLKLSDIMENRIGENDKSRLSAYVHELEASPLKIYDKGEGRMAEKIVAKYAEDKPDILIVDNLNQLVSSDPRIPRHEHVRNFSADMRLLTISHPVAVIMVAHCNRNTQNRKWGFPSMYEIAESDSIGRDVDTALLLSWPWLETQRISPDELNPKQEFSQERYFINIAANRYGEGGAKEVVFNPQEGSFYAKP